MRNKLKLYVIIFLCAVLITLWGGANLASAEEEQETKPITIDLNTPRVQPNEDDGEEDLLEEKYHEILSELTISEEAELVAENIKNMITTIKDLTLDITIVQIKGERSDVLVLTGMFGVEHRLARLEFLEPSALRGQIVVIDQDLLEVRIFQPVTNQIAVRELEDMSKEALSALNVAQDITSYFDFTQYEIAVLETKEYNGVKEYSLEVRTEESEALHIRVTDDTWFPTQIIVFEDGVQAGEMTFNNVTFSPGLEREDFQNLPKVKEVRL